MATALAPDQLRKGAKVIATTDLRGVPEGTAGRVMMVSGLSWIRYWVRFDNGVSLGSISRDHLATKKDLAAEAAGPAVDEDTDETDGDEAEAAGPAIEEDDDEGAADDAAGGGATDGVTTPAGTFVPQKFLDRSAAARTRLGG